MPFEKDKWIPISPERLRARRYAGLPKVGDRCLFMRTDGFRFYGLVVGKTAVRILLSGQTVSMLGLTAWKPAYEREKRRHRAGRT